MSNTWRRARISYDAYTWIIAAGVVTAIVIWHYRLRFPFDDTFISFRYAEHLAAGYGLVWNIGGPHTEGYTNFLFVLLLAAARLFSFDLLSAAQIIGLVATIATGLLLYRITTNARDKATGLLALALYWIAPLTWINALSGMETSLFVMLCTLSVSFAARKRIPAAFVAVFFATLTRPEGALLFVIIVAVGISREWDSGTSLKRRLMPAAIFFVVALALYALWKWWYFGEVLPNSFYVKVLSNSHSLFPGLQYVRLFLVSMVGVIVLSLGIRAWRNTAIIIAAIWITALLSFYLFVLPLEGLYDRFLWPAFTMLCITAAVGVHDLAEHLHLRSIWIPALFALVAHATLTLLSPRTEQSLAAHEEIWDANMGRIVRELKALPHFDSLRLAYGDAGYVVYQSGIQHIDLFGLNDTRVAHAHGSSERAAIVRSERPDILLLPIRSRDSCWEWVEDAYGVTHTNAFESVASIEAFPYTLELLLNTSGPWYSDCKSEILRRLSDATSVLHPTPQICY